MRVLGATKPGNFSSLVLQEIEKPQCGPSDILIRVAYAEVNPVDLQKLNAFKQFPEPFVPGYGGSGTIEQVGNEVPTS